MIKFVCYLRGVEGLERPVKSFAPSLVAAQMWAKLTLKRYGPPASIEIYEVVELHVDTVYPEESK